VLIALAHDLLITAGVYALFDREVTTSTVAALLTIMGYSLYDTVIVFDRIRENVPRMPRATFSQIANRSMSEVFTRSLATSFVVLMPVGALLLFGGETLKDFAFALLVGVASGAYSSIFIATPVLVEWKEREQTYMRRRRLILREHGGTVPAFASGAIGEPATATAGAPAAAAAAPAQATAAPAATRTSRQERARRRAAQAGSRPAAPTAPPADGSASSRPEPSPAPPPAEPPAAQPDVPEQGAAEPAAPEPTPPAAPPATPERAASQPADGDETGDGAPPAGRAQSRVTSTSGPGKSKRRTRPRKKHGRR
jgi:SecD/SecF fusion protein